MRTRLWLYLLLLASMTVAVSCSAAEDKAVPDGESVTLSIAGRVFDDANGNGKPDAGEQGLRGIRVSDGVTIVRTGRDGSYKIDKADPKQSRFVFVVTPSGRRASGGFYREVSKADARFEADFALVPCKESANPRFTFAQVTDIHVTRDHDAMVDDLAEIAGFKPAFVVATGDMVNNGRELEQLQAYASGLAKSPLQVFNVPGNHDASGDLSNYESILGPGYYSFDFGGCHFVIINCVHYTDVQAQWLQKDLQSAGGMPVLAFQHYHPNEKLMDLLARYNTLGLFTGHWHTTKVFPYEYELRPGRKTSVMYINSPPLSFGGIDTSARGFVLASVDRGKLSIEHRYGGAKKHLVVAAPADGAAVSVGDLQIRVGAYDSASPSTTVEYCLDGGSWRPMHASGAMSWSARERPAAGTHVLAVRAAFANGAPVEKQVRFTVSSCSPVIPRAGDPWATFHHDAARTGASRDAVSPPLRLAWSSSLGGVVHAGGPSVVGDTVYIGIADEDCAGRSGVYALDARTGAIKWRHPTNGAVRHSVTVADGRVYALSVAGEILALDACSGKLLFAKSMSGVAHWPFSSPVVSDGVLYVGTGDNLTAMDAKTGERIWANHKLGSSWISCLTSPAVDRGRVLMGLNWGNGLYALNRRNGEVVWNAKKGFGTSHCTPAIADNRVYHAADGKLYALDKATSNIVWERALHGGWTMSSPAVSGDMVVAGGPDGYLYCLDAATGKDVWLTPSGDAILYYRPYSRDGNPFVSSPAISGDVVYCGSGDGKLYAYDLKGGKVVWSYDLGVPVTSSPAVSGNTVYVATYDGTVYAFSAVGV